MLEAGALVAVLAAQAFLLARSLHVAADFDEGVYLASVDLLRHGERLGSDVFAPQFPGFYDLLRALAALFGLGVADVRTGMVALALVGTAAAWAVGRRFGGVSGGLLAAALLVVAPPLDLFAFRVLADPMAIALMLTAAAVATVGGAAPALAAGVLFGAALSVKLTALTALPVVAWLLRRRAWPALAGAAAVAAVLLVLHASALPDLWESAVVYHREARTTPPVIPHPHRQIVEQIPLRTPFAWLALAALAVGVVSLARRRALPQWPLWAFAALTVLFLLWHAPLHDNHLILFPAALAVAAGATLGPALPRSTAVCVAACAVVAAAYVQQVRRVDETKTPEPPTNVAAARAVEHLTRPDEVVVADRPIVPFLAGRLVPGPLVDTALLRFETGSLTPAEVVRGLTRVVVSGRAFETQPPIVRALQRGYRPAGRFGGVTVWVRRAP